MRVLSARAALFGTVAAAAFITTPAFAQTAQQTTQEAQQQPAEPAATTAPDPEGQDTSTGEIVVTARRTEERLQRVPGSVSAFNERALDRIQAQDTTGLQGAVPNLNIVQGRGSSNATNIYIRGIGQPDALQTFDPAVGVYVDDVYLSRIRGTSSICSISSGSRSCADPRARSTARTRSAARSSSSPASRARNSAPMRRSRSDPTISSSSRRPSPARMTKTLSAGISVIRSKRDGFVKDVILDRRYNDKDTVAVRGALAFTPSDRLRVDITADYSQDDASLNVGSAAQRPEVAVPAAAADYELSVRGRLPLQSDDDAGPAQFDQAQALRVLRERSPTT